MRKAFSKWWNGRSYFIEDVYPGVRYERHWTSEFIHLLIEFYLKHWKWIIGVLITITVSLLSG
ncbi:hypothetical protein HWA77_09070 [Photobacterium damselae subsp. damselae]|uniref:Uncharacterized protein n=1 Tax=Photobacterium damselae subsp. damselae TaxID=85581 RepID=A0A850QL76_PHODD|nr:hypothetical protein [Photobacterium damselae subsp. damselae]